MNREEKALVAVLADGAQFRARGERAVASGGGDASDLAIGLIANVGKAARDQEERVAHVLRETERVIRTYRERLEAAERRASDAEAGLEEAKDELRSLVEKLGKARDTLTTLKDQVITKENTLAAMTVRAESAKQEALDMSAVLSVLIEEIKSSFPAKSGSAPHL
jgi:chromosome segregation ATPase